MNRIYYLLISFCFSTVFAHAQDLQNLESLQEAEAKAALNQINFVANENTANYDVIHHQLDITVDPAVAYIEGEVTTTFTALENMSQIIFDFDDNMLVNSVTKNGNSLTFTQNVDDELVIFFENEVVIGNTAEVVIDYEGNPASSGFGSFEASTHAGTPIMWTLSEPYGAKAWWPCKQDLNDKIDSIDIIITAPSEYTAVSNGLVVSEEIVGENKTVHWQHNYKIPAYLVAFAVTDYVKYTHMAGSNFTPFPIDNYVYPENLAYAQANTPVTVDIMDFFEDTFGPYPFNDEKYGHAQFGWGGGMEHTTISFMGDFNRSLIAHELGHHWFGDKVTTGSWQDIWLNEGFATYMDGMVVEHLDGEEVFQDWRYAVTNYITSQPGGSVYVPASDTLNVSRVFSSRLSYYKGSMVLHMLRKKLGDEDFFNGVQAYLTDPELAYDYAVTPNLRTHLEVASGLDLTEFFQDWVYGEGYPIYDVEWNQTEDNNVHITIAQEQSHPSVAFFEAPVQVFLLGANGETEMIFLENTENQQVFTEAVDFQVVELAFDPQWHLIRGEAEVSMGVNNPVLAQKIRIYPNPASDLLQISAPASVNLAEFEIFNSLGQQIFSNQITENKKINISALPEGFYILKIKSSEGEVVKKFIKN